jgi:hypothetical protein
MALIPARRAGFGVKLVVKAGPGDGKTFTSLRLASELADECSGVLVKEGANGLLVDRKIEPRIAMIETEDRGREYAEGRPFWFMIEEPEDCSPKAFRRALENCRKRGCRVVVIDSLTDEWRGRNGCLEQAGHEFQKWSEVKDEHWALLADILAYPGHVVMTLRVKEKFAMSGAKGSTKVQSMGYQAEQEKYIEYRFPVVIEMDEEKAVITKSACDTLKRAQEFIRPGRDLAAAIHGWTVSSIGERTAFEVIRDHIEAATAITMADLDKQSKGDGICLDVVVGEITAHADQLTEREVNRLREMFKLKRKDIQIAAGRENMPR